MIVILGLVLVVCLLSALLVWGGSLLLDRLRGGRPARGGSAPVGPAAPAEPLRPRRRSSRAAPREEPGPPRPGGGPDASPPLTAWTGADSVAASTSAPDPADATPAEEDAVEPAARDQKGPDDPDAPAHPSGTLGLRRRRARRLGAPHGSRRGGGRGSRRGNPRPRGSRPRGAGASAAGGGGLRSTPRRRT